MFIHSFLKGVVCYMIEKLLNSVTVNKQNLVLWRSAVR